jgi:glutamate racemase
MGEGVTLVSSADETARDVYALLVRSDLQRDPAAGPPSHRFLTTGRPDEFGELGRRFLGPEVQSVEQFSWVGTPA